MKRPQNAHQTHIRDTHIHTIRLTWVWVKSKN